MPRRFERQLVDSCSSPEERHRRKHDDWCRSLKDLRERLATGKRIYIDSLRIHPPRRSRARRGTASLAIEVASGRFFKAIESTIGRKLH